MKASEQKALFRLLEDKDPLVVAAVNSKITELGQDVLEALHITYKNTKDKFVQSRVLKLADKIVEEQLSDIFDDLSHNNFDDLPLIAFCLSKVENAFLKKENFSAKLNVLKKQIIGILNPTYTPLNKVKILNHIIFSINRFKYQKKQTPTSLSLDQLLSNGEGAIETFIFLYLIISNAFSLPLCPLDINTNPILAWCENKKEVFYLNIGAKGAIASEKQIKYFLTQKSIEYEDKYFKAVDIPFFVKQFLEKMKIAFLKNNQLEKMNLINRLIEKI